jgi:hypothetical protein
MIRWVAAGLFLLQVIVAAWIAAFAVMTGVSCLVTAIAWYEGYEDAVEYLGTALIASALLASGAVAPTILNRFEKSCHLARTPSSRTD